LAVGLGRRHREPHLPLTSVTPVVTSEAVYVHGQPVRLVVRLYDEDDLWVLLANTEGEDDEGLLLHAAHLLDADRRLTEVLNMEPGTVAVRHLLDGPWVFRRFRRNEEYDRMLIAGDFQPLISYSTFEFSPDVER
jgi:hypothetical protein